MSLLLSAILGGLVALVLFKMLGGSKSEPAPPPPPPQLSAAVTRHTTVYIVPDESGTGIRVNAAPEVLFVRRGDRVAWTVVDTTGSTTRRVSFRLKKGRNPFDGELSGFGRFSELRIRKDASFQEPVRYSIFVDDVERFDPEIQMEE